MRSLVKVALAVAALCVIAPQSAHADAKSKIKQKATEAMENFDLLEFDEAKKLLGEAISLAKKNSLRNELVATVYVRLGVVYFSGFEDTESAKLQFVSAVEIDSGVEIDAAYSTAAMAKLLTEVKKEYGGGSVAAGAGAGDGDSSGVDCDAVEGFTHELVEETPAGSPVKLAVNIGADLKATKVNLHFRAKGATKFGKVKMKKKGDCTFAGEIPAKALSGDVVHYYVAALSSGGKKVGNKGSKGSPNIIEIQASVTGAGFGDTDEENPLDGGGSSSSDTKEDTTSDVKKVIGPVPGSSKPKLFLSIAIGSGGGYVNGETEQVKSPVGCCVAPALLHVFPELGYFISERLAIGAAFRMGFPIGANRQGHATAAPAGLLRVHYALLPEAGVGVTGAVGAGLIRHTVKIEDQPDDMNVDTTASGPVLLGAGANYQRALSGPMKFVAELNLLSALGGMEFSGVKPGFAVQFDANLGIRFAF